MPKVCSRISTLLKQWIALYNKADETVTVLKDLL